MAVLLVTTGSAVRFELNANLKATDSSGVVARSNAHTFSWIAYTVPTVVYRMLSWGILCAMLGELMNVVFSIMHFSKLLVAFLFRKSVTVKPLVTCLFSLLFPNVTLNALKVKGKSYQAEPSRSTGNEESAHWIHDDRK